MCQFFRGFSRDTYDSSSRRRAAVSTNTRTTHPAQANRSRVSSFKGDDGTFTGVNHCASVFSYNLVGDFYIVFINVYMTFFDRSDVQGAISRYDEVVVVVVITPMARRA